MATLGANYAGTGADNSGVGTVAWTNPTNAQGTSNSTYATCNHTTNSVSHYLLVTNFGFTDPGDVSSIDGILAEILAYDNGRADGGSQVSTVKLVKGGTVSGNNKSDTFQWGASPAYRSYGGAADLWGLTFTISDITASNFGMVLSNVGISGGLTGCGVDTVRITVYYTGTASGGLPARSLIMTAVHRSVRW